MLPFLITVTVLSIGATLLQSSYSSVSVSSLSRESSPIQNCALLFFGLPREFKRFVLPSIQRNLLEINPHCDIFIHTYNISTLSNPRNGEWKSSIDVSQVFLLTPNHGHVMVESVDSFYRMRNLTFYGQYHHNGWGKSVESTNNMIKQWHSIDAVWKLMQKHETYYHRVGLFRLDTIIVTPIDIYNSDAAIPDFGHHHGGLNDRLFYGLHDYAEIWATHRFESVPEYLRTRDVVERNLGLHSEFFIGWLMRQKFHIPVELKDICVWRTRQDPLPILIFDCEDLCGKAMKQLYANMASAIVPLDRQEKSRSPNDGCPHLQS
jgi:hypothetical protein